MHRLKIKKKWRSSIRHLFRWSWYAFAGFLAIVALLFTTARIWLPSLAEKKAEIEDYLSRKSAYLVRIDRLHTYWDGLHPGLQVIGLRVFSKDNIRPSINLAEMRISLALFPLLWGDFEISNLVLIKPSLAFERLADGRFRVTGFDPIRVKETQEGGEFINWMITQRHFVIEDGELQWFDHQSDEPALYLSHANLSLKNAGDRHKLGVSAKFPENICSDCSLALDITGNPFTNREWDGEIYLRASGMDIANLPKIAREKLQPGLSGKLNVRLWTEWEDGLPNSINGRVEVSDFRHPVKKTLPIAFRHAHADLVWRGTAEQWDLRLEDLKLGLQGPDWSAGNVTIRHLPSDTHLSAQHLDLEDVSTFIGSVDKENKVLDALSKLAVQGAANDIDLRLKGSITAPDDFLLQAEIAGLNVRPYKKFPGFIDLNGKISVGKREGHVSIDTSKTKLILPKMFTGPIDVGYARGSLHWEKSNDHWLIEGNDLFASSPDGRGDGRFLLRIPVDRTQSPYLNLRVDFSDGNGAHTDRYYPINVLKPTTIEWLKSAIVSGTVTNGYVVYDGKIREFPFHDSEGTFDIYARVKNAVFNYMPGWLPIKEGIAEISSDGKQLLITGDSGMVRDLKISKVVAHAKDLRKNGENLFNISGVISGPVSQALAVVRHNQSQKQSHQWINYFPSALQTSGDGTLSLRLVVYPGNSEKNKIKGEYMFRDSALMLPNIGVKVENTHGTVLFTKEGITGGQLQAHYLGGDVAVAITRVGNDQAATVVADARGTWTALGLRRSYDWYITKYLEGQADWRGSARFNVGRMNFSAKSGLQGIKMKFPDPLNYPDGLDTDLELKTEYSDSNNHRLSLRLGQESYGSIVLKRVDDKWTFRSGHLALGNRAASLPKRHGLHFSARAGYIDADPWLEIIRDRRKDTAPFPEFITRLSGDFESIDLFDRHFGKLKIDMSKQNDGWIGSLQGDNVDGSAKYSTFEQHPRIDLNLRRLTLPKRKSQDQDSDIEPSELPTLIIKSQIFNIKDMPFGKLLFQATHIPNGWSIDQLHVARDEMDLQVDGDWIKDEISHRSSFDIQFVSQNLSRTLETYGNSGHMDKGKVDIKAKVSWNDMPIHPSLANIEGSIDIKSEDGRFLQVKQGAGRLFGLLDLSSIARYLTLDFTTLFGRGFVYNKIHGDVDIENGNAFTDGLIIRGPSAQLKVIGRMGLTAEDYDLELWMTPRFRESLTVTSWGLWGPQAAAVALAIQKLFKKQISKKTSVGYIIKGPWKEPEVTRVAKEETGGLPEQEDSSLPQEDE